MQRANELSQKTESRPCVDKEPMHKHMEQTSRKGTVSEGEYIIDIETHLRFKTDSWMSSTKRVVPLYRQRSRAQTYGIR